LGSGLDGLADPLTQALELNANLPYWHVSGSFRQTAADGLLRVGGASALVSQYPAKFHSPWNSLAEILELARRVGQPATDPFKL
jgi:hypothetical protein